MTSEMLFYLHEQHFRGLLYILLNIRLLLYITEELHKVYMDMVFLLSERNYNKIKKS